MLMRPLESAIVALVLVTFAYSARAQRPSCLDESGKEVDWFMGYKIPYKPNEPHPFNSGYAYAYFTSDDAAKAGHVIEPNDNSSLEGFTARVRKLLQEYIGIPGVKKNPKRNAARGTKSLKTNELKWTVSEKLLSDPDSIMMRTLAIAYGKPPKSLNAVLYNDDPPMSEEELEQRRAKAREHYHRKKARNDEAKAPIPGFVKAARRMPTNDDYDYDDEKEVDPPVNCRLWKRTVKAHAKGVVLMDDSTDDGLWLTHSFPQFPPDLDKELKFGSNTHKYGQSFMCVSFSVKDTGTKIIDHLAFMTPWVYDTIVTDKLKSRIPQLQCAADSERQGTEGKIVKRAKLPQSITTKAGQELKLYSKSKEFGADLYSDWIDQDIDGSLFAETWQNGPGRMGSACPANGLYVNNVKDLAIKDKKSVSWTSTSDHSKWAISEDKNKGVVCIGDSNRMESQKKRGAGAVCIKCPTCWSAFSSVIDEVEPCPVESNKKQKANEVAEVDWIWVEHLRKYF